jgi:asparagine synthase (glutamine-hydrolysing)
MTAIAGLWSREGAPVTPSDLDRMAKSMPYRGTATASWHDEGPVGLVRVSPRPRANPRQHELHARHGCVIAADARIDNRDELRDLLRDARLEPEAGDEQIVLAAYLRWGEEFARHLLGDFAVAIWDSRQQALVCARDQLGIRPFCYHYSPGLFAFGSEIKSVLALPSIPRAVDDEAVRAMLTDAGLRDPHRTLYRSVSRLPAGFTLRITHSGTVMRRFWSADPARRLVLKDDRDYAEGLRELIRLAVACRLPDEGPVGSMLSGGLDSSIVTCMARQILVERGTHVASFSARYPGTPECDESPFIDPVIALEGVEAHTVYPEELSPLSEWPGRSPQDDHPCWLPQISLQRSVFAEANSLGLDVVLSGTGGDWVFSHGFSRLTELLLAGRLRALLREHRGLSRRMGMGHRHLAWNYYLSPVAPVWVHSLKSRVFGARSWRPWDLPSTRGGRPFTPLLQGSLNGTEAHFRSIMASRGLVIESEERAAALHGVEARFPLLDRRIVEFCLSMPSRQKLRDGWTRYAARVSVGGILPDVVRWRPGKANLSATFMSRLLTEDRPVLDQLVGRESRPVWRFLPRERMRGVYDSLFERRDDGSAFALWVVVMLDLWLEAQANGQVSPGGIGAADAELLVPGLATHQQHA